MSFRFSLLKKKGTVYASIVEDHYDPITKKRGTRSIRSFGDIAKARAADPEIDDKIRAEVKKLNDDTEAAARSRVAASTRAFAGADLLSLGNKAAPLLDFGIAAYRKLWRELGLDGWFKRYARRHGIPSSLDMSVFCLVASRILRPSSKHRTFAERRRYLFDFSSLSLDDMYETLDRLAEAKVPLVRHINKRLGEIYERIVSIALYDVTTFYFESFDGDGLRERGMSKDHKTNETQVVLGLLIDGDGMPLDYELFPGNTSEMKTMIEIINGCRASKGLSKLTVIADRGLNSKQNLGELEGMGCDFIVAQSIDRMSREVKHMIFDDTNWDEISLDDVGDDIFKIKRIALDDARDLIVTWSSRRAAHDMKVLEERWAKANNLLDKGTGSVSASFSNGSRQFIKAGRNNKYSANDALYEKRKKHAGYYALSTSCADMPSGEVYGNLRQLWKIEDCFRVMKTNLDTRPVFVWKPERIRGHFVMCYVALVLQRLLERTISEHGVEVSTDTAIRALSGCHLAKLTLPHRRVELYERVAYRSNSEDRDEETADRILSALGIDPILRYETADTLRKKLGADLNIQ